MQLAQPQQQYLQILQGLLDAGMRFNGPHLNQSVMSLIQKAPTLKLNNQIVQIYKFIANHSKQAQNFLFRGILSSEQIANSLYSKVVYILMFACYSIENTSKDNFSCIEQRQGKDVEDPNLDISYSDLSVQMSSSTTKAYEKEDLEKDMQFLIKNSAQQLITLIIPGLEQLPTQQAANKSEILKFLRQYITAQSKEQRTFSQRKAFKIFFEIMSHKQIKFFEPKVYFYIIKKYECYQSDETLKGHVLNVLKHRMNYENQLQNIIEQDQDWWAKLSWLHFWKIAQYHANRHSHAKAYYYSKLGFNKNQHNYLHYSMGDALYKMFEYQRAEKIFGSLLSSSEKQRPTQELLLIRMSCKIRLSQIKRQRKGFKISEKLTDQAYQELTEIKRDYPYFPKENLNKLGQSDSYLRKQLVLNKAQTLFAAGQQRKALQALELYIQKPQSQKQIPQFLILLSKIYFKLYLQSAKTTPARDSLQTISYDKKQAQLVDKCAYFVEKMVEDFKDQFNDNFNHEKKDYVGITDPLKYIGFLNEIRSKKIMSGYLVKQMENLQEKATSYLKSTAMAYIEFADQLFEEKEYQTQIIIRSYVANNLKQYISYSNTQEDKLQASKFQLALIRNIQGRISNCSRDELDQIVQKLKKRGLFKKYIKEIGQAYLKYNRNKGMAILKEAIQLSPNLAYMHVYLKQLVKYKLASAGEVLSWIRQLNFSENSTLNPQQVIANLQLYIGDLYKNLEENKKAIQCYEKCLENGQKTIIFRLIECYEEEAKKGNSNMYYQQIIDLVNKKLPNLPQNSEQRVRLLRIKYNAIKNKTKLAKNPNNQNSNSINDKKETMNILLELFQKSKNCQQCIQLAKLCLQFEKMQKMKDYLKFIIQNNIHNISKPSLLNEFRQFLKKLCYYHNLDVNTRSFSCIINEKYLVTPQQIKKHKLMSFNYVIQDYQKARNLLLEIIKQMKQKQKQNQIQAELSKLMFQFINLRNYDRENSFVFELIAIVEQDNSLYKILKTARFKQLIHLKQDQQERNVQNSI